MKGKAKKGDCRDISGTVCCPNAVLAFFLLYNKKLRKGKLKF